MHVLNNITVGQILTILAIIGSVVGALRHIAPLMRRWDHMLDDLIGHPARPGVPAQLGVLERLALLESSQAAVVTEVAALRTCIEQREEHHESQDHQP